MQVRLEGGRSQACELLFDGEFMRWFIKLLPASILEDLGFFNSLGKQLLTNPNVKNYNTWGGGGGGGEEIIRSPDLH